MSTIGIKWAEFKAWFKKNLPGWLKQAANQAIDWLVPFLLQHGMTFLVSQKRKIAYNALHRDPVKIPSDVEHEDDC